MDELRIVNYETDRGFAMITTQQMIIWLEKRRKLTSPTPGGQTPLLFSPHQMTFSDLFYIVRMLHYLFIRH